MHVKSVVLKPLCWHLVCHLMWISKEYRQRGSKISSTGMMLTQWNDSIVSWARKQLTVKTASRSIDTVTLPIRGMCTRSPAVAEGPRDAGVPVEILAAVERLYYMPNEYRSHVCVSLTAYVKVYSHRCDWSELYWQTSTAINWRLTSYISPWWEWALRPTLLAL